MGESSLGNGRGVGVGGGGCGGGEGDKEIVESPEPSGKIGS